MTIDDNWLIDERMKTTIMATTAAAAAADEENNADNQLQLQLPTLVRQ